MHRRTLDFQVAVGFVTAYLSAFLDGRARRLRHPVGTGVAPNAGRTRPAILTPLSQEGAAQFGAEFLSSFHFCRLRGT
jgi:hypothetical protein